MTGLKFEANKEESEQASKRANEREREREKWMEEERVKGRQLSEQKGAFHWKLMSSAINFDIVVILSYGLSGLMCCVCLCVHFVFVLLTKIVD